MSKRASRYVPNCVIISDLHVGCQMGLCPPEGFALDGGGRYAPSRLQRIVWSYWREFWDEWVPTVCRGDPFSVVVNGDAVDGQHHDCNTSISNLADQAKAAKGILEDLKTRAEGRLYIVRGTEAHDGKTAMDMERIAQQVGALPDRDGRYSRPDLRLRIGRARAHIMHHIGTTSSSAHEASAVNAELTAEFVEAARWGGRPPDFVVRSHRHRFSAVDIDTVRGIGAGIVTPGWQLKTPFTYRLAGARVAPPQFGGVLLRAGDEEHYYRRMVWSLQQTEETENGEA